MTISSISSLSQRESSILKPTFTCKLLSSLSWSSNNPLHSEDFGLVNARRLLDKYRPHMACFNDDVQGTGCVTLAAIMAGLHITKLKLPDMKLVIFGAGTAGTGIADMVRDAIAADSGKSKEEAAKQIWCVDKPGLLLQSHGDKLTHGQESYARDDGDWKGKGHDDLLDVIKEVKPHVLIGTSTKPKAFTEEVVKEMAKHVERPIILPLSNPTRLHEAVPEDLYKWTDAKALVATGSPFPPVKVGDKEYEIGMSSLTLFQSSLTNIIKPNVTTPPSSPPLASAPSCPAPVSSPTKCLSLPSKPSPLFPLQ
jgi:malic enzyme